MKSQAFYNPNRAVIADRIKAIQQRGEIPAAAIRRALTMQNDMRRTGASLDTWIDAVAVLASWHEGAIPEPQQTEVV
ncbi:MAG: hypothetical protein K6T83_08195 [Alicyclobacillus sp.]|nr:hypothetical protein [Alicyclobacillus sp.]